MKVLPNFIIIGAGKSGTTALYEYLHEHPEVYMSAVKETNFFALEGETLIEAKDDPEQMNHYPWSITTREAYEALFDGVRDEKAVGEVSPMYLYHPDAPAKIKSTLPNAKLIVILRNPVDRLYSRYMHLARERREPSETFEECLNRDSIWWRRNDLIQEGFYYTHLKRYFDLFDKGQIKVYLYDELRHDPLALIQDMYGFIGVNDTYEPDFGVEYNVSGKIKNPMVDRFIGQNSIIKSAIASVSPRVMDKVKNQVWLKKHINNLRKQNITKPPLKHDTRVALIQEVYGTEVANLQKLIDRDLSKWLDTIK
jgi:hypothetical protein